jgi:hypothetical protein
MHYGYTNYDLLEKNEYLIQTIFDNEQKKGPAPNADP